jgi:RHS repeat-associated protein
MGYSLTTPLDRPTAHSHASPKTHTPLPRLQERGLRYYSTELSRWASRDPIGEWGGKNLYAFVGNRPISLIDPSGLKAKNDKRCCCAGKPFQFERSCCKDGKVCPGETCTIKIFVGHSGDNMEAKLRSQEGRTGADRISAVSCNQEDMNALIPEEKAYPNSLRHNEYVYKDFQDTGSPQPTVKREMAEELAAATVEANAMCDMATSRGLCCDDITITMVGADKDGDKAIQIFYPGSNGAKVTKVKCGTRTCEQRGGNWEIPRRRR